MPSSEIAGVIHDRLYGPLEFTSNDLRLFQTPQMSRLRQLSLSAIPPWVIPTGTCASKFEHSVGAAYLAKIVGQKKEFRDIAKDLYFALLAHDLGTPPFSHFSERLLRQLHGKSHEKFARDVILNSEFAKEVTLQGGNIDYILQLVEGSTDTYTDLVNGSIDIDNLDNTIRYGLSMGLFQNPPYSPVNLVRYFSLTEGRIGLVVDDLKGLKAWESCRQKIYDDFVYNSANIGPGSMLLRALDFAAEKGELPLSYFFMTDAQAFQYLKNRCNPQTSVLTQRAENWAFYEEVFSFVTTDPSIQFKKVVEKPDLRSDIANIISSQLSIPLEDVTVFLGKNRGHKKIHNPIYDLAGNSISFDGMSQPSWIAKVYLYPEHAQKTTFVQEFMIDLLQPLQK